MRGSSFRGSAVIPLLLLAGGCSAILGLDPVELQSADVPDAASSSGNLPPDGLDAQADAAGDATPDGATPGAIGYTGPSIAIGAGHACAITAEGKVKCWGNGMAAGAKLPVTTVVEPKEIVMAEGGTLDHVIAVTAGHISSCALRDQAPHMVCWGRLPGSEGVVPWATEVDVAAVEGGVAQSGQGLLAFSHAKSEATFGCVVSARQTGYCRGANTDGQLGAPNGDAAQGFVQVVDGTNPLSLSQIATGETFACARTDVDGDHGAACWGLVPGLDDDSTILIHHVESSLVPLRAVRRVAAGSLHACAVTGEHTYCWGSSGGRLGRGDTDSNGGERALPPGPVLEVVDGASVELTGVLDVAAGAEHSCFLIADNSLSTSGVVRCSGAGAQGQLGYMHDVQGGDFEALFPAPEVQRHVEPSGVAPLRGVREVVAGHNTSCARTEDGKVYCWGTRHLPPTQAAPLHRALDMKI